MSQGYCPRPVTLSASLSKTPAESSYYYTNYDRSQGAGYYGYYYYYYYRYYNSSYVSVPSSLNTDLNQGSGSSSIPITWYITKEYFRTADSSWYFSPSSSDISQGDAVVATSSTSITGCPKQLKNGRETAMSFTTSVDFNLGITSADWNAYKESGHTYSMDFDIYITVNGS